MAEDARTRNLQGSSIKDGINGGSQVRRLVDRTGTGDVGDRYRDGQIPNIVAAVLQEQRVGVRAKAAAGRPRDHASRNARKDGGIRIGAGKGRAAVDAKAHRAGYRSGRQLPVVGETIDDDVVGGRQDARVGERPIAVARALRVVQRGDGAEVLDAIAARHRAALDCARISDGIDRRIVGNIDARSTASIGNRTAIVNATSEGGVVYHYSTKVSVATQPATIGNPATEAGTINRNCNFAAANGASIVNASRKCRTPLHSKRGVNYANCSAIGNAAGKSTSSLHINTSIADNRATIINAARVQSAIYSNRGIGRGTNGA